MSMSVLSQASAMFIVSLRSIDFAKFCWTIDLHEHHPVVIGNQSQNLIANRIMCLTQVESFCYKILGSWCMIGNQILDHYKHRIGS